MSTGLIVLLVSVGVFGLVAAKVWWLMGYVKKQAEKDAQAEAARSEKPE